MGLGLLILAQVMTTLHPAEEEATPLGERSHELREALSLCLPPLVGWARANAGGLLSVPAGLELLKAMLPWMPLDAPLVCAILPSLSERAAVQGDRECLEVLLALAKRPAWSTADDVQVRQLIMTQQLPYLGQQLQRLFANAAAADDEDDYQVAKGLVDYLLEATLHSLKHHAPLSASTQADWQPAVGLMTALLGVPSLLIAASLVQQWWVPVIKIFTAAGALNPTLGGAADGSSSISLEQLTVAAMQQLGWQMANERRRPLNRLDFAAAADDRDFEQLFTAHRHRLLELLRLLAHANPRVMVSLTQQALGSVPPALWMQLLEQVCRGIGSSSQERIEGLCQLLALLLQELRAESADRLLLLGGIRSILQLGMPLEHDQLVQQLLPLVGANDHLVAGRACDTLLILPPPVLYAQARLLEEGLQTAQTHVERFLVRLLIRAGCTGLVLTRLRTRLIPLTQQSQLELSDEARKQLMSLLNLVMVAVQQAATMDKIGDDFGFIRDWTLLLLQAVRRMPAELLSQPPANQQQQHSAGETSAVAGWLWMLQSNAMVILGLLISRMPQTKPAAMAFLLSADWRLWEATALVKHLWLPVVGAGHAEGKLAQLMAQALPPTIKQLRQCLNPAWQEYRQLVQSSTARPEEFLTQQQEMERLLHDCTLMTVTLVHDVLLPPGERDVRKDVPMEHGVIPTPFKSTSKLTTLVSDTLDLPSLIEDAVTIWQPNQHTLGKLLSLLNRWYPLLRGPATGRLLAAWGQLAREPRYVEHRQAMVSFLTELIKLHLLDNSNVDLPAEFITCFTGATTVKSQRSLVQGLYQPLLPASIQRKEMPRLLEKLQLPPPAKMNDPAWEELDTASLEALFSQ